jgi:hypothetical protein
LNTEQAEREREREREREKQEFEKYIINSFEETTN